MRLINADELMEQFRLAEISMEQNGKEYANCFLSSAQEISTEWWCVEEMVDNAPSIEPCEDAISRAEAIRIASGFCAPANVAKELEKLPSVTPERKRGKWERVSADRYTTSASYFYRCNLCGERHLGKGNFCPNCGSYNGGIADGADMREEPNENNSQENT